MMKHGCLRNTQRAYKPKVEEFKLYCKTYFNKTTKLLVYQVTTTKVDAFLTYIFLRSQAKRPTKGGLQGEDPIRLHNLMQMESQGFTNLLR